LLYLYCALRQLRSFPGFPMELTADAGVPRRRDLLMLVIANARIFGGGFQVAPGADLADGLLDAVAFGNMGLMARLKLMQRLKQGTHPASAEVEITRARSFRLRFDAPPAYETDGEWNRAQAAEVTVTSVPGALEILVPAGA
jgi:diacylglycerol kinase family enzyme